MGQAKLRGTFEERKAQAIKAGRIKKPQYNLKHGLYDFTIKQFFRRLFGN